MSATNSPQGAETTPSPQPVPDVRGPLRPEAPFRPNRTPFFYGWVVLAVSTLGILMSVPGQTIGVSVFTERLLRATDLSRLQLSNAYLAGTIASGLLLPWGGRVLDRCGARATAMIASAWLGLTLGCLAWSDHIARALGGWLGLGGSALVPLAVLIVGFTSLRFSGQGMLTMVSRTMLGKWFDRRRGMAAGTSGVFVSFGFASAPLVLSTTIDAVGWRHAWIGLGVLVGGGMTLIAWLFYRDNPEECGLEMDGPAAADTPFSSASANSTSDASDPPDARELPELDRDTAIRTAAFWAITLALAFHGLAFTGITFHIVDIGAENGLLEKEAVALFLPMAVVSTSVGYGVGLAADRLRLQWLFATMMGFQVVGFAAVGHLGDPLWRWVAVGGLGFSGGFFGPLSTAALPRFFGRTHLGAISGFQMMCMVVASALGPTLLATSRDLLASYRPGLYALCVPPVGIAVLALRARNPRG